MRYFFISILLLFVQISYGQKQDRNEQLTILKDLTVNKHKPEKLLFDIDFVYQNLKENHPNLYRYISKNKLRKKIDSLKSSINSPLTSSEFRAKLMSVISFIGDGHIEISRDFSGLDSLTNEDAIPYNEVIVRPVNQFHTVIVNNRLFILRNSSVYSTIKNGSEVLKIDGVPMDQIIKTLARNYIASDGYNETLKYHRLNAGYFAMAYSETYGIKDSLTYLISDGSQINEYVIKRELPILDTIKTNIPEPSFKYVGLNTIKVGQFSSLSNTYYQEFFKNIKTSHAKEIVIDLRDSQGGDVEGVKKLFSFLIKQPEFFFKRDGKGYVTPKFNAFLAKNNMQETNLKNDFSRVIPNDSLVFKGKVYILINGRKHFTC